ncbi:MAG: DUF1003 domain-containing protein [Armatimonadota bacterium]
MSRGHDDTFTCQVCRRDYRPSEVLPAAAVHGGLCDYLSMHHPEWSDDGYICLEDLNRLRREYVTEALLAETREMESLERAFREGLAEIDALERRLNAELTETQTFWDRLADRVAAFGGSWPFLISLTVLMTAWVVINTAQLFTRPFDPYPYILLNLVISGLAAVEAPLILMSQSRQDAKDRLRAKQDLRTNLRAEIEVRNLNHKMDQLLTHQWQHLLEIQQMQMEMMEELTRRREEGEDKTP